MKKITLYILLTVAVISVYSQSNVSNELNKVRDCFINAKQIGFEVEVYHYPTKESKGILLSKGGMLKSGDNYYSNLMGVKMIVNKSKGTVIIDDQFNEVTYFPVNKKTQTKLPSQLPDSLFDGCVYVGNVGSLKKYKYISKDKEAAIPVSNFYVDNNNYLKKIEYFYNNDTEKVSYNAYKVEVIYKNFTTENISAKYFDLNKIIAISKNKVYLTKEYSAYTLIN